MINPIWDQEFFLACDASKFACGNVCYQYKDGKPRIIGYNGKSWRPSERVRSQQTLELDSLIFCLETWSWVIASQTVTCYVDNKAISQLLKRQNISPCDRIGRLILMLSQFPKVTVRHLAGKSIGDVDSLSRMEITPSVCLGSPNWQADFTKLNFEDNFEDDVI